MFYLIATCLVFQLVNVFSQEITTENRKPVLNPEEFLYQVLISEYDEKPMCGGVLVEKGIIITSATCVWNFGGIKKFLEGAVLYGGGSSLVYELGDVKEVMVHPQYLSSPRSHDLAVLKYTPVEKSPNLKYASLNKTWKEPETCVFSSWWNQHQLWPERLTWTDVSLTRCSEPEADGEFICLKDADTALTSADYGSPIVCSGILRGIVPEDPTNQVAINITANHDWIVETIEKLKTYVSEAPIEGTNSPLLLSILSRLNDLVEENKSTESDIGVNLNKLNNQVVIPLSYVLFAMVVFFFVLLFFIVMFTVVLVYYSRK